MEHTEYFTLTPAQERLFYMVEFDKRATANNVFSCIKLDARIDKEKLLEVVNFVIKRHDSLRTCFELSDKGPLQKIVTNAAFKTEYCRTIEGNTPDFLTSFIEPFDLHQAPLLRVGTSVLSDSEFVLMLVIPEIIGDLFSVNNVLHEIASLYCNETINSLTDKEVNYKQWVIHEDRLKNYNQARDFWLKEYEEEFTKTELPLDTPSNLLVTELPRKMQVALTKEEVDGLKSIATRSDLSVPKVLTAVYVILLSKLCHSEHLIVGLPVSPRERSGLLDLVGLVDSVIPVRIAIDGTMTFSEFVQRLDKHVQTCLRHDAYSFECLLHDLKLDINKEVNPLFDGLFLHTSDASMNKFSASAAIKGYGNFMLPTKSAMALEVHENTDGVEVIVKYKESLLREDTIKRYARYYKAIVSQIVHSEKILLSEISILSREEQQTIVKTFNNNQVDFPTCNTILDVFKKQALNTPENIAYRYLDKQFTYSELVDSSDRIATYLRKVLKINQGDLVGLVLERDEWLIPCIFGILKSGAAYVPIDPRLPKARIDAISSASKLRILITTQKYAESCDIRKVEALFLDETLEQIDAIGVDLSGVSVKSNDLAYVIYTSGSTGTPKGVMIEHHSLTNIIQGMDHLYPLQEKDCYMLKTTYSFDVSVAEIFGWFMNGGSLSILPHGDEGDVDKIIDTIKAHTVTHINFVPSMLAAFVDELQIDSLDKINSLKYIFAAGETLSLALVKKFDALKTNISLENIYGPTEGTIYSCGFSTKGMSTNQWSMVPIGKPLCNINLYIMDKNRQLVPVGVQGELYIGGEAVAKGYLNNDLLTEERFPSDPFVPTKRMYKTGDLVKWLDDGNIAFLGRMDHQVKLRGFRIELGDIENQLQSHPEVKECVVVVIGTEADSYLAAYYASENEIDNEKLRMHLAVKLPEYMLPTYYKHINSFPLTSSGKIDRKSLLPIEVNQQKKIEVPATSTEETLRDFWAEVLIKDISQISVTQNFLELGGHSLRAMKLVNRIFKGFNVSIPLQDILSVNTIRKMADYIDNDRWLKSDLKNTVTTDEEFIVD